MTGNGRVALVTGAGRRIGAAIARGLGGDGYAVAVHYRHSRAEAEALAGELDRARAFHADLRDTAACEALVASILAAFGRLDLVVNNASTFHPTPPGRVTGAQWDELMASNLKAPFFISQAAAGELARRRGSIVNITDVHAERPMENHAVYCAAKAGLDMLTRALAKDLGPAVRVNAVAPGSILWPEGDTGEAARPEILDLTALKRQGTPEDIADAVRYLAGAGYVTGHVLVVDGGRSLNI